MDSAGLAEGTIGLEPRLRLCPQKWAKRAHEKRVLQDQSQKRGGGRRLQRHSGVLEALTKHAGSKEAKPKGGRVRLTLCANDPPPTVG